MNLKLYYFDACPFCQMVLRKIDQLDLKDQIEFKDIIANPEFRDEHIDKTGRATTPCLYIDEDPLFESQDIMEWLEENQKTLKN